MFLFGSNSERFFGCGLMILHGMWHADMPSIRICAITSSSFQLTISGVRWNTCCWSNSMPMMLLKLLTSSVSICHRIKRLLIILINRSPEANSWNCVNIEELEIISVGITVEHIGWLLVSNKLHSSEVLKITWLISVDCTLNSISFCASLKIYCLSHVGYGNSTHCLIELTV
jgi:hypothetical protein